MKRLLLLLIAILVALAATPCRAATIDFAQVFTIGTFTETNSGTSNTLAVISAPVKFQFLYPVFGAVEDATLNLSATTTATAQLLGGVVLLQTGYKGTFTITRQSDGKVLLSGTFGSLGTDGASLTGMNRGSSATLTDSVQQGGSANEVIFASDFLTFAPGSIEGFSFSMAGVNPNLGRAGNNFMNAFTAGGTGIFSSDFIPEPISFLLVGTGLAGVALLRRRRK